MLVIHCHQVPDEVWAQVAQYKRERKMTTEQALVCAIAIYNRDHKGHEFLSPTTEAYANAEIDFAAYYKRVHEQEIADLVGYATALINYEG